MDWWIEGDYARLDKQKSAIVLTHEAVAGLNVAQAKALSLPETTSLFLKLDTRGQITDAGFSIICSWRNLADQHVPSSRTGAILRVGETEFRIPEPLFSLVEEVERFQQLQNPSREDRIAAFARLQEELPRKATEQLTTRGALRMIRVVHAVAFSLSLHSQGGRIHFDPVLFGRSIANRNDNGLGEPVSEAESLLSDADQETFARRRFGEWQEARSSYPINNGLYVFVDEALKSALNVVRQKQEDDEQERWAFARNPHAALREALEQCNNDASIESLFIETEQYSRRVVDIGAWSPPILPWIKKQPNDWLPEGFGIRVGNCYLVIEPQDLNQLMGSVKRALEIGDRTVRHEGQTIPASRETLGALQRLVGIINPQAVDAPALQPAPQRGHERTVLVVDENFETVNFAPKTAGREGAALDMRIPIRSALKPHQLDGLKWLQRVWLHGFSGALLADDMGLGKTLQALVFLRWIQEAPCEKLPILIVAPTGLLPNWKNEHERHLQSSGLGECLTAYGAGLRQIRTQKGPDIKRGTPGLDSQKIAHADWVLASYETVRDYQLSIAPVRFACVVFDEMQKVKNPASLISHSAKTLNADFSLGLTGTPVENKIEDLWSIMDILSPGLLGDLRSFSARYASHDEASGRKKGLADLRTRLFEPRAGKPPIILRRMKSDHLEGLPRKQDEQRRKDMPHEQTDAYDLALAALQGDARGGKLQLIHRIRGISLHPFDPQSEQADDAYAYIQASARTSELFDILDRVEKSNEKALIFLENLTMQDYLAMVIQDRYRLERKPLLVNGRVQGPILQQYVDEFQNKRGTFDVMILSPRAGGVGLTLTAANHVIHLSRWWNPAVENQCTDRTYRIGQERNVHVYYPMAIHPGHGETSFDCVLHRLLQRKRDLSRQLLIVPPVDTQADIAWMEEELAGNNDASSPVNQHDASIEDIDRMSWDQFERWAIQCLQRRGYVAFGTPAGGDGGADVVARHPESDTEIIVQCKHTGDPQTPMDRGIADDLLRARTQYDLPNAALIGLTNADQFTQAAADTAGSHRILLVARERLLNWLSHCGL